MKSIGRRDFLKMVAAVPAGMMLSKILSPLNLTDPSSPNIIVIVLDALTAHNMSLYGYRRRTTPHIEHFASRSDVYHAHHSAGTFTTPGTASILTGTYPWTHRAVNLKGLIARDRYERNIFRLLSSCYNRVAFTQNPFANYLLSQMSTDIDEHLPIGSFSELNHFLTSIEGSDYSPKFETFDNFLFALDSDDPSGSLVLGTLNKYLREILFKKATDANQQYVRRRLIFNIDDVFSGLLSQTASLDTPSFCYFHLFPPHGPYSPKNAFRGLFRDGWNPKPKPQHPLPSNVPQKQLNAERLTYDQYIATTDTAFGRFVGKLETLGILEDSYLILTSDHGESFERGYKAHSGPLVYEPGVHIPLLISAPGQRTRRDFYSTTNSVDLLPTLLQISGLEIPEWVEGRILPGYGPPPDHSRITFSMDAKQGAAFENLSPISIAMYQGDYKLIYYEGYGKKGYRYHDGFFELYNLKNDPEEVYNLAHTETAILQQMKDHLLEAYHTANQPIN